MAILPSSLIRRICYGSMLLVTSSHMTEARNGFIPHYVGLEGIIGGAGTALPLDGLSTITNPAGLPKLPCHILGTLGMIGQFQHVNTKKALFGNPIGNQRNKIDNVPILSIGYNYNLNSKWSVGFALDGGGGLVKLKHPGTNPFLLGPTPPGRYDTYAGNRVILTATTLACEPTPGQYYGISLLVSGSYFKTDLALPDPAHFPLFMEVKGRKHSSIAFGVGTRIGGLWDFGEYVSLGASVATPVYSQRHRKYKQLFKHKFQIPATMRVGLTFHLTHCTDFSIDYKELFYGESKWVRKGQHWHNMPIFLVGIMHKFTKELTLGIGYNYGRIPIRKDSVYLNTLSVPLDEHNISGGFNYKFDCNKKELFLIAFYEPKKKITDNGKGLPGGISKGIHLESYSFGFELGYRVNF